MCLLVVASRVAVDEPLIIGANRDEFLSRPATSIAVLADEPVRIVGGRDDLSGGTWLAVNEHGVAAGLTNQPLGEAKDPTKRSRGELPLALARHRTASVAVEAFVSRYRPVDFNGAFLLVADRTSAFFIDFTGPGDAVATPLPAGIHVLENRPLGEPSRKVDLVRTGLGRAGGGDAIVGAFRRVLVDHRLPEGADRPNAANCVHREGFGTRSSCLVRVPTVGPPRMWVADGPPCTTPYVEVDDPWAASAVASERARTQSRTSGL